MTLKRLRVYGAVCSESTNKDLFCISFFTDGFIYLFVAAQKQDMMLVSGSVRTE